MRRGLQNDQLHLSQIGDARSTTIWHRYDLDARLLQPPLQLAVNGLLAKHGHAGVERSSRRNACSARSKNASVCSRHTDGISGRKRSNSCRAILHTPRQGSPDHGGICADPALHTSTEGKGRRRCDRCCITIKLRSERPRNGSAFVSTARKTTRAGVFTFEQDHFRSAAPNPPD